jgi:pimeloyl-ACP methyl ester carboxylesterase
MNRFVYGCIVGLAVISAGCQISAPPPGSAPAIKEAKVDAATLSYVEQGQGVPVVFVHGAISDHRTWDAQRDPTARKYRYIAFDQRYFGPAPWPDDGKQFSVATHANDLAAFLRQLDAGPVHLVAWSYGASVVLVLAVQHPELVRSLFLYEPAPMATFVTDPADLNAVTEDRKKAFGGVAAAVQAKDGPAAVRMLLDGIDAVPGTFDAYPRGPRSVALENARTLPLAFAAAPPPTITCAQLGAIKAPTAVVRGELTRPFLLIIADAASRCIPGSRLIVVPNTRHLWPAQDPAGFNRTLLAFLADQ